MRARVPYDLIGFRSLLGVGLRHLLLGESAELSAADRRQFRVNPSDEEKRLIEAVREAFGWSVSDVISRALALAQSCNLSPCPDIADCHDLACPGPNRRGTCPAVKEAAE